MLVHIIAVFAIFPIFIHNVSKFKLIVRVNLQDSCVVFHQIRPESPRWLLAQGKFEDALTILEVMARVNGNKLPNSFRIKLRERVEADKLRVKDHVKSMNSFDLCR